MGNNKNEFDELSLNLFQNFQRIFRCLSFGRSLKGKTPSLTGPQMRVLSFFGESEVVHISEICNVLGMSMQSLNNMVHRLEVMGYVKRSKNSIDKRLSDIRFTDKGRQKFKAFRNEQVETLIKILSNLEPYEIGLLNAAVENAAMIMQKASIKNSDKERHAIGNNETIHLQEE